MKVSVLDEYLYTFPSRTRNLEARRGKLLLGPEPPPLTPCANDMHVSSSEDPARQGFVECGAQWLTDILCDGVGTCSRGGDAECR